MKNWKLILVGLLMMKPLLADQSHYTCHIQTDSEALLGESFVLSADDETAQISSKEIGVCVENDSQLEGQTCSLSGKVAISLLDADEDTGYVYAYNEKDEVIYYCGEDEESK